MNRVEANVALSGDPHDAVSPKDIFCRLKECRDFEIKLQWERAVFLTAFLIACYAGYGSLALSVHQHGLGHLSLGVLTILFESISFVGFILSILWIMMAKGSKAWYEHYENAIDAYAQQVSVDGHEDAAGGNLFAIRKICGQRIDRNPLSTNGGPFSVSRIVIVIGELSMLVWIGIAIVHAYFFYERSVASAAKVFVTVVGVAIFIVCAIIVIYRKIRSAYLLNLNKLPVGDVEMAVYYGPFLYSREKLEVVVEKAGEIGNDIFVVAESPKEISLCRVRFRRVEGNAVVLRNGSKRRVSAMIADRRKYQNGVILSDGKFENYEQFVGSFAFCQHVDSNNSLERK